MPSLAKCGFDRVDQRQIRALVGRHRDLQLRVVRAIRCCSMRMPVSRVNWSMSCP
jgi:hypothetical protein